MTTNTTLISQIINVILAHHHAIIVKHIIHVHHAIQSLIYSNKTILVISINVLMDTSSITLNANYALTPFIVKPVLTLSHVHPVLILSITINKNVSLNAL